MAEENKDVEVQQETAVDQLASLLGEDDAQKGALYEFISRVGKESAVERVNGPLIDSYIKQIDEAISAQMDEILHHQDFQELESAWRGLEYLVKNTQFTSPIKIELFDVSKEELYEDLESAETGEGYEKESVLWEKIYWNAYDKVGGHPYSCIISDYQFDNSMQDINLMEHLSIMSESAQVPFIGNASAQFFGHESFEAMMSDRYLEEKVRESPEYKAWHSFRDDDRSKYIGLALPRFLGRLPYGDKMEETKNFKYSESMVYDYEDEEGNPKSRDSSSWISASFAMGANIIRSFENWGWSVKIVGVESGGQVEKLPVPFYEEHGETKEKVPVEASVGQAKDQELCDMGFMPLAHWDRTNYACFFEAPSVQRPKVIKDNEVATANYSVGARMQYTLLVTRIAHFLKYRQLRFVGRNAGKAEIKQSLSEWLEKLVSDFNNPQDSVVAQRPLRSFQIEVEELEDRPGFFQVTAEFRPHIAIVGMDIKLRLVAYHSGEE